MSDILNSEKSGILSEMRPFFHPRSIAVVGVSKNPTRFGSALCRSIKEFGFSGPIYPVSSSANEFMGLKAYPSLTDIPMEVDLAYICLPAPHAIGAIKECKNKGIRAVQLLSSGFSETGTAEGRKLEAELTDLAGDELRIIGPNCFGVYCPSGGLTQIPGIKYPRESGSLGVISQSGGISEDICRLVEDYGIRISHAVSYGNACDISELELLQYFESHPQTNLIAVYLEGVKKGKEFFKVLKRLTPKKPVIFWKGGLTPEGAKVVTSHTASLSGSEEIWTAMLKQTGAIQVFNMEELMDTASAFYHLPPLTDKKVAVVNGGGGVGVSASDACYRAGLEMAKLSPEVREKIASFLLPVGTSARNPIDVGPPFPPAEMLESVMETLAASKEVGTIILEKVSPSIKLREHLGYGREMGWDEKPWIDELPVRISERWGIPVIVIIGEITDPDDTPACEAEKRRLRRFYQEQGIAVYPTVERALKSLGRMIRYYRSRNALG